MAINTDVPILNIIIGPISSVQALGTTFVIINDAKIASDLLEKRSAKYSHRPFANFAGKLLVRLLCVSSTLKRIILDVGLSLSFRCNRPARSGAVLGDAFTTPSVLEHPSPNFRKCWNSKVGDFCCDF